MISLAAVLILQAVASRGAKRNIFAGLQAPRMVYPRLLQERADDGKLLLQIHDGLTLKLEKASIAAPNFYVHKQEAGSSVVETLNGEEFNSMLYQDEENLATVTLSQTEQGVQVEGLVGPQHRIEPLVYKERSDSGTGAHMIYEIPQMAGVDEAITIPGRDISSLIKPRNAGNAPKPPPSVTVEVFFLVDEPHHRRFKTTADLIAYLCVLLNSVNLRFRKMQKPKVRLLLVGVKKSLVEPFLSRYGDHVRSKETVMELKLYAKNNKADFTSSDVFFYITGRDLVSDEGNGNLNPAGQGIAFASGVCSEYFVGIGEDTGGYYTGVRTITHEMGHLLGAEHDGDGPSGLIHGHPGARSCPFSDGYIMSYSTEGLQQYQFSSCSLEQMRFVITMKGKACWALKANVRLDVSKKYPGSVLSISESCKQVFPGKSNVGGRLIIGEENECKLRCEYNETSTVTKGNRKYTQTKTTYQDRKPLDYTSCGQNKVCIQGVCQNKPKPPPSKPTKKKPINAKKGQKSSP